MLLGVLDLVLTTVLLRSGGAHENNPLARLALMAGGLRGLIGYKCALLAVVTVVTQIVALHRPRLAQVVLTAGLAVQLFVVTYSVALLLKLLT